MAKVLIISGVWTFLECAMLALTIVIYSQKFRYVAGHYHRANVEVSIKTVRSTAALD
jgi:hypothetical protein